MNRSQAIFSPKILPPLDQSFQPAVLANRHFHTRTGQTGVPLVIGLERNGGEISRYETTVLPDDHPDAEANLRYTERLVKFLLWQKGGFKLYIGGSSKIGDYIRACYSPDGIRKFDCLFMGSQVYEQPFKIFCCNVDEVPSAHETGKHIGRNLDGFRIGFDLGGSDRKLSAVVNGKVIFSEEVVWEPQKHTDPEYHYREIITALKSAAARMPQVDAIGGSSAGIYVDSQPMVASLFRAIPRDRFGEVKTMFTRISAEMGVPLVVFNDGDVTALAGSMRFGKNGVLGIALGSSQAAGYVDVDGNITGWLNELSFAPVDYSPTAPTEEWSGDKGCGSLYFSQQCVFRLAPSAGIQIPGDLTDVDKLKFVQRQLEGGDSGAKKIWHSMGIYLGYGIAHYADFYDFKHVVLAGRCTSGCGGDVLLEEAKHVLKVEFPDLFERISLYLPDENNRRIGQSIAAASLPVLK